jgi:hypothetical protein
MPLLIIGGSLAYLDSYRPEERVSLPHIWERRMRESKPQVVILGNSIVRRDVDIHILANMLGINADRIHLFSVPDSSGALWYAALKNRVYENGYRPRLVMMAADLSSFLGTEPITEEDHRNLMAQLGDNESVIAQKVYGGRNFRWLRLKQHRGDARAFIMGRVRDLSVGFLYSRRLKNTAMHGRSEARPALDRVFADENIDWDLHKRVISIVEEDAGFADYQHPSVQESLVPDICDLTAEMGTPFVFVRTPLSPDNTDDHHPPMAERAVVELMNEKRCGFLDLRGLDLRDRHFDDPLHMNPAGASLFTQAMATALLDMGALNSDPIPLAIVPVTPVSTERIGTPAPLPPLGPVESTDERCVFTAAVEGLGRVSEESLTADGYNRVSPVVLLENGVALKPSSSGPTRCNGVYYSQKHQFVFGPSSRSYAQSATYSIGYHEEIPVWSEGRPVYWVYPGTTMRLEFDQPWQGPEGSFAVRVVAETFGDGEGQPTMSVAGADPVELVLAGGRRFKTQVRPEPPSGNWHVEVTVPDNGPLLMIQGMTVGHGHGSSLIIGTLEDNRGSAIRLIGGVTDRGTLPEYKRLPPPIPSPDTFQRGQRQSGWFFYPEIRFLADNETMRRVPYPTRCSPVRIVEDGRQLPLPHALCGEVHVKGHGRMCHEGENLYFSAVDGTSPFTNGRAYSMVLDPDRQCQRSWWLYPGDTLTIKPNAEELARFRDGVSQVEMDAMSFSLSPSAFTLKVRLLVNGQPYIDSQVSSAVFRRNTKKWALEPPIQPGTTDVVLEVSNPSKDVFALVTMASISEYADFGIAGNNKNVEKANHFSVVRVGEPPELPQRQQWRKFARTNTQCGYRFIIGLPYISDSDLHDKGLGRASPLMFLENDQPMKPHATVREFQGTCAGAFGHTGRFIWFSPTGEPGDGAKDVYKVALSDRIPVPRVNGEGLYWVYPGTALRFDLPAWNAEKWGEFSSIVQVQDLRTPRTSGNGVLSFGGVEYPLEPNGMDRITVEPTGGAPQENWSFEVRSPADGPYLIVHHVGFGIKGARKPLIGRFNKPVPLSDVEPMGSPEPDP